MNTELQIQALKALFHTTFEECINELYWHTEEDCTARVRALNNLDKKMKPIMEELERVKQS